MPEEPKDDWQSLAGQVRGKEDRKLRARRLRNRQIWFGLGMFGMIGWAVVIPTLIAIAIGIWIDHRWPSRISWTLTLLILGVMLGCWNAWHWLQRESQPD